MAQLFSNFPKQKLSTSRELRIVFDYFPDYSGEDDDLNDRNLGYNDDDENDLIGDDHMCAQ